MDSTFELEYKAFLCWQILVLFLGVNNKDVINQEGGGFRIVYVCRQGLGEGFPNCVLYVYNFDSDA